jgi:hypothetical protein
MRVFLFLCILVPQLVVAQVHPSLDPFSEALLAAFHTGDARQFELLLSTSADHALVVKAVEDAAPTDWMDSLQTKPYPGKVKFRAACLALRAFGEERGIDWSNMSALHPEELTNVMRQTSAAPNGCCRQLNSASPSSPMVVGSPSGSTSY